MKGGYRPAAGIPKRSPTGCQTESPTVHPVRNRAMTPLEYALDVINSPEVCAERRDRLAIAFLPFCHQRASPQPTGNGNDWGDDLGPLPVDPRSVH